MIRQKVDVEAVDSAGIQTETLPHDLTTRYRCAARARCAGMDHFEDRWWERYSPKPNLLVYVNLSAGEPTSLYAWGLTEQFGESFQSAWLLWQSETFRLWPNPAKIKVAESVGGGVTTGQSQSSKSTSRQ